MNLQVITIGIGLILTCVLFSSAQDAPVVFKPSRATDQTSEQLIKASEAKAKEADTARRMAAEKARSLAKARDMLAKQQKKLAAQKAALEAQAIKNAERRAKEEIAVKQSEGNQANGIEQKEAAKRMAERMTMAAKVAEAKANEADAAKRMAAEKAAVTDAAKAALAKQRKRIAEQKAAMEAQSIRNAERMAREEIIAKRDAELKMQPEGTDLSVRHVPDTHRQSGLLGLANDETGKPVTIVSEGATKEKWRVALGVLYRKIGAQRFKMGSYSADYAIGKKSSQYHAVGAAGGLNDSGNRVYDDGYVKSDAYTDLDNGTWNWGYDSGAQVKGNRLELTGVEAVWRDYSRQTTATDIENSDNADYRSGLMVTIDRSLAQTSLGDYGLSLGLSRAQTFQAYANGINNFNDDQAWATYNARVLDSYDITGLGITPDSVPYNGNPTDKGPVIDVAPMTRQSLGNERVSEGAYRAYNSISESLDMNLSTLSLGMSVRGKYRRLYVVGATGPTLNMVETDATYSETLYALNNGGTRQELKYWSNSASGTEYLFGYYVQAEVGIQIYRELHLGLFGRYDWLENISGDLGPSRYEVNPSGGSLGGTVGLNF